MTKPRFCLMWPFACMRNHFQLTSLCNSLSNKYIFIRHFCGKHKVLLVKDSQFLSCLAESREINLCSGFIAWQFQIQSRTCHHFLFSLRDVGDAEFGLWLQPVAKMGDFRFHFTHFCFGCNIFHGAKKGGWDLAVSTPQSCVDFTCVCPKGRAVLSLALEILFLTKKSAERWYLHTQKINCYPGFPCV